MTGLRRVPRTRGALSGLLLVLLGIWGAFAPFVGPYADFGYTPANDEWIWTEGRGLFSVLPGAAAAVGGLILLVSASRMAGALGAWLAALAGAWFVVGPTLSVLWDGPSVGSPLGDETRQVVEQLTFFTGLGVVIVFLAALALGRLAVVGVRDAQLAEREAPVVEERADHDPEPGHQPKQEPWIDQREQADDRTHDPHLAGAYQPDHPVGRYSRPSTAHPDDQHVAGVRETRPDDRS